MGKQLVIESLQVRTDSHSQTYEFKTGVNAVTGPISSGKSSMLELLKYGLGGSALVMPAVRDNVRTISIRFWAGDEHWEFTRSLGSNVVQVFDLTTQESLGEWAATNRQNMHKVGPKLMAALELPSDWRIPRSRKKPTEDTVPVSFWDVYKYLYLDQNRIDANVIGHTDANLNNKRIAVFELIYGLANARTVELLTERGRLRTEMAKLQETAATVARFLQDMGDPDPAEVLSRKAALRSELERSQVALAEARDAAQNGLASAESLNAIGAARNKLDDLIAQHDALAASVTEARSVTAQLNLEEQRIKRNAVASTSLSGLDFVQCPRCLQKLPDDRFDVDHCHLCGLEQLTDPEGKPADALLKIVREQRRETEALGDADTASLDKISAEADVAREALVALMRAASDGKQRATLPYLATLEQTAAHVAATQSALQRVGDVEARWATHQELHKEADRLSERVRQMAAEEASIKLELNLDTTELTELSQLFEQILEGLKLPWFTEAYVDSADFLPRVGGEEFHMVAVGGGRKTIVNLAYHLANLYMSISATMLLPTLLVVDSPRKNVGDGALDKAVVESIYERLRALQSISRDKFQIIFADNDMPKEASAWVSNHIILDYKNPLVPGVKHGGKDSASSDPKDAVELK